MRPSQVTYQGRFCYLCAFSASPANWRCIHIYAVGIYICMHVAECAIPREKEMGRERERDWFMLGPYAVIPGNSVVVRVVICIVSAEGAAVSLPKKKIKKKEKNPIRLKSGEFWPGNSWLVLLQDAQSSPSVATASALICSSSWLWPWTLPMRFTWWRMGNSEHRSEWVLASLCMHSDANVNGLLLFWFGET